MSTTYLSVKTIITYFPVKTTFSVKTTYILYSVKTIIFFFSLKTTITYFSVKKTMVQREARAPMYAASNPRYTITRMLLLNVHLEINFNLQIMVIYWKKLVWSL